MLKRINLLLVVFVITVNAYSQGKDCTGYPFYLSGGYVPVYYTDSTVVNGITVYTDSIIINIVSVDNIDTINGSRIYISGHNRLYNVNYPFTLTNNPPFKKAIYRNDSCGFSSLLFIINSHIGRHSKSVGEKRYAILSSDDKYINYASLTEADGEFYTKYNPIEEDCKVCFSFSKNKKEELMAWIRQKMNKGLIVSIGIEKKTYIAKLFAPLHVSGVLEDAVNNMDVEVNNFKDAQAWAMKRVNEGYMISISIDKKTGEYVVIATTKY
jgi:hypothetical protein